MKRILFVPLDERPCNYAYPLRLFKNKDDIEVVTVPSNLLGHKKIPANIIGIRNFILNQIDQVDVLIYSTEMLVYGGLLPSRIYDVSAQKNAISDYQEFLTKIRQRNQHLLIFASNLIMRTPKYSSSDEEPDYYEQYGKEIFRFGWLKDKENRDGLQPSEVNELTALQDIIPQNVIQDYEIRRKNNLATNMINIDLVEKQMIDFLVIPQDDSAPYGYTARDQAVVYPSIKAKRLQNKIITYPGADESGYTLLARAVQFLQNKRVAIYPIFSGKVGQTLIPLYEDRPLIESLHSHILAAGATLALSEERADLILAVNVSGNKMIEASVQQSQPEITYDTYRNLRSFVDQISNCLQQGKKVAIADSAYGNGGDLELLSMLDANNLLSELVAYRAWNTNCNTLGSTIGSAIINLSVPRQQQFVEVLNSIIDDVFYQAVVRSKVTNDVLSEQGLSYFDLKDRAASIAQIAQSEIRKLISQYLYISMKAFKYFDIKIDFPWNRMFEVNAKFKKLEVDKNGGKAE